MGTNEIIKLATLIKEKYNNTSVIDIIKSHDFELSYTNLKPNLYPAYTVNAGKAVCIVLNSNFNPRQQNILAAHELGHALIHQNNYYNQFGDDRDTQQEYEANLFAVSLLFNQNDLNVKFSRMSNYELKYLLDYNLRKLNY